MPQNVDAPSRALGKRGPDLGERNVRRKHESKTPEPRTRPTEGKPQTTQAAPLRRLPNVRTGRAKDMEDLKAGRPVPSKAAYRRRVQRLTETEESNRVAKNLLVGLRRVCRTIMKKRGQASGT